MTTSVDLAGRLEQARRDVEAPAAEVTRLETALQFALDTHDYAAAQSATEALTPARQELAIAQGLVTALEQAQAALEEQRHQEQAQVQHQQRVQEARESYEGLAAEETRQLEMIEQHIADAFAGVAAVRESLRQAVEAEAAAWRARQAAHDALVLVDGRPRIAQARPNRASVLVGGSRSPVLHMIFHGKGLD